jgi:hypothetical protein
MAPILAQIALDSRFNRTALTSIPVYLFRIKHSSSASGWVTAIVVHERDANDKTKNLADPEEYGDSSPFAALRGRMTIVLGLAKS